MTEIRTAIRTDITPDVSADLTADASTDESDGDTRATILIVGEWEHSPEATSHALAQDGYEVLFAACPADVLATARRASRPVDLVVTTWSGEPYGRGAAAALRVLTPSIRALYLAAPIKSREVWRFNGTHMGVWGTPAPVDLDEIVSAIRWALTDARPT